MMIFHHLRRLIYRLGFRPRPSSVWYSPTLAWARVADEMRKGMEQALREETIERGDGR
jgi:hypothetical protein